MRRLVVFLLALGWGPASAIELPFTGVFGSPAACDALALGGKEAVLRGGTAEDGSPLPIDIEEDDGFLLLEPSELTTIDLSCSLAELRGTRATFDCSDGEPLSAVVLVRNNNSIMVDAGDPKFYLKRCRS